MFPADSLAPQYLEEQSAKYAAKRQAQAEAQAAQAAASASSSRSTTPSAFQPKSGGILGNIFQGLAKVSYAELGSRSALSSPGSEKSELEALIAEKKRDADICSMPTW